MRDSQILLILIFSLSFLLATAEASISRFSNVFLVKFLREKGFKNADVHKIELNRKFLRTFRQVFVLLFFLLAWLEGGKNLNRWLLIILSITGYIVVFDIIPNIISILLKEKSLFFYPFLKIFNFPFPQIFSTSKKGDEKEGEYLEIIIEESEKEGLIKEDEGELLEGVIKFRDVIVRDVMTPRANMVCVSADSSLRELKEIVVSAMHSRIPVYSESIDNIIGIVLAKDLLKVKEEDLDKPVSSIMRETFFIPETLKIHNLLQEFQKRRQKMAIVIDEFGGVSGLVTSEDLLEEIVGELKDEYERDESQDIIPDGKGYILKGDTEVDIMLEKLKSNTEISGFKTVGGFITGNIRRIPEKGEEIQIGDLRFTILEVGKVKIEKIKVEKIES